jgi:hypothetical protein
MAPNNAPPSSRSPEEGKEMSVTKGSRYRVISKGSGPEPIITLGVFKGYTAFGHDTALVMQMDPENEGESGLTRLIPAMVVLAVDILSFRPEEKEKDKEEVKVYFG